MLSTLLFLLVGNRKTQGIECKNEKRCSNDPKSEEAFMAILPKQCSMAIVVIVLAAESAKQLALGVDDAIR